MFLKHYRTIELIARSCSVIYWVIWSLLKSIHFKSILCYLNSSIIFRINLGLSCFIQTNLFYFMKGLSTCVWHIKVVCFAAIWLDKIDFPRLSPSGGGGCSSMGIYLIWHIFCCMYLLLNRLMTSFYCIITVIIW